MKGRRVYPRDDGTLYLGRQGDYGRDGDGDWWVRPPRQSVSILDNRWSVTEHEDDTITVSPSIAGPSYHGFLVRGEWSDG